VLIKPTFPPQSINDQTQPHIYMEIAMNFSEILGDLKPTTSAPSIAPIDDAMRRPRWSVMIPTFNCAEYLRQTLEAVLAQDPGQDQMQIEVIDDCSTKDDPQSVVREIGKGRVDFHRKPANGGANANFNTCIERSRGELIHILHGDDWILPEFYKTIEQTAEKFPDCALYATRSFFIDETNIIQGVTMRLPELEDGGHHCSNFITGNSLQFAGVVMRRSFYEKYGGFRSQLVHCADWEMWARAIRSSGARVCPEVLTAYRIFESNDTGRLMRTGENLKDRLRLGLIFQQEIKGFDLDSYLKNLVDLAYSQSQQQVNRGDQEGAFAARQFSLDLSRIISPPRRRNLRWFLLGILNRLRDAAIRLPEN
jgi:hypothetical protein